MKLDGQEKHAVLGAIKAIFASTPEVETDLRIMYVDMIQRIESDLIGKTTTAFIAQLADKILERTEKLLTSQSITEEVSVRATVVKDVYARIKEKAGV